MARALQRGEFGAVTAIISELKKESWEVFGIATEIGRDLAFWLARTHRGTKLPELSEEAGGIDCATVSAATARWKKRAATDRKLMKLQPRALQVLNAKDVTQ